MFWACAQLQPQPQRDTLALHFLRQAGFETYARGCASAAPCRGARSSRRRCYSPPMRSFWFRCSGTRRAGRLAWCASSWMASRPPSCPRPSLTTSARVSVAGWSNCPSRHRRVPAMPCASCAVHSRGAGDLRQHAPTRAGRGAVVAAWQPATHDAGRRCGRGGLKIGTGIGTGRKGKARFCRWKDDDDIRLSRWEITLHDEGRWRTVKP